MKRPPGAVVVSAVLISYLSVWLEIAGHSRDKMAAWSDTVRAGSFEDARVL